MIQLKLKAKKTPTVCKSYNSSNYGLNKTHVENIQGKHTTKKISVFVGNTYYRDIRITIPGNRKTFFLERNNVSKNPFFPINRKKSKNHVA